MTRSVVDSGVVGDADGRWGPGRRYCPACGVSLGSVRSSVSEYWEGQASRYLVWCAACGWTGEVSVNDVIHAPEPAAGDGR